MYAEKEPTVKGSEAVLNDLLGNLFTIGADDKTTGNCKYSLATVQAAQNQK